MSQRTTVETRRYHVEIEWGVARPGDWPLDHEMIEWVEHTLTSLDIRPVDVSIRIMDGEEIAGLNEVYRSKSGPTNVLSFPADDALPDGTRLLGDIAICAEVMLSEAREQGKPLAAHVAHILVHAILHLLGHDHLDEEEAQKMEQIEVEIVADFGFPDPYQSGHGSDQEEGLQ